MRRKNPHPQRAVNVKTGFEGGEGYERGRRSGRRTDGVVFEDSDDLEANHHQIQKEEEEGDEEGEEADEDVEQLRRILTRVPCDDDVVEQKQTRKDAKGVKRKRGQHECDVCEKVFGYPSVLARHMRIHANEKPYECDVCEMRFRHSNALKVHMRIHTNEKAYECHICEKRYHKLMV